MRSIVVLLLFAVLLDSCQSGESTEQTAPSNPISVIRPPLPEANVPYHDFEIDADKGDTLFASSGSIVVFPAQSLVDGQGKLVTGKVKIRFREFADALDQYFAGIPMTFDSAGTKLRLVSSGMFEIKALKDSLPIFANPARNPIVHLATAGASEGDQLYYLDTVHNRWVIDGEITTSYTDRKVELPIRKSTIVATTPLVPPVLPGRPKGNNPVLEVKIDPTSFGELGRFNNLQFQVDGPFDPKDSEEQWHDVSLERAEEPGKYMLKFTNARRSVSYIARPVLEGEDLEKAKKVYEKELAIFNQKRAEQWAQIERAKKQYAEDSLKQEMAYKAKDELDAQLNGILKEKNERTAAQNKIIGEQNILTEKANRETVQRIKDREGQGKVRDSLRKVAEEKYKAMQAEARTPIKNTTAPADGEGDQQDKLKAVEVARVERVYRSFSIRSFGYLNCDIQMPDPTFFAVTPDFRDEAGNKLDVKHVGGMIELMNSAIIMSSDQLTLVSGRAMMIWAVVGDRFAYLDYKTYRSLNITPQTKQVTLVMKLTPLGRNNYEYVRAFVGQIQRPLP